MTAILGWRSAHSTGRTLALASASLVAFLVWFVVVLEIQSGVTGVPIRAMANRSG